MMGKNLLRRRSAREQVIGREKEIKGRPREQTGGKSLDRKEQKRK